MGSRYSPSRAAHIKSVGILWVSCRPTMGPTVGPSAAHSQTILWAAPQCRAQMRPTFHTHTQAPQWGAHMCPMVHYCQLVWRVDQNTKKQEVAFGCSLIHNCSPEHVAPHLIWQIFIPDSLHDSTPKPQKDLLPGSNQGTFSCSVNV